MLLGLYFANFPYRFGGFEIPENFTVTELKYQNFLFPWDFYFQNSERQLSEKERVPKNTII